MDITNHKYYENFVHDFSLSDKLKNDTYYSNRYFTAILIMDSFLLPVYFVPLRQADSLDLDDLLDDFLREVWGCLPLEQVLADGYFYLEVVLELLDFYGRDYLFNMKNYAWVKHRLEQIWAILELLEAVFYR